MRTLDETTLVAGQLYPGQVSEAAALGVTNIVNNRPDCEEPGQPASAEIEAAAHAAGLSYHHVPIGRMPADDDQVAAMARALGGGGKSLAFCKSGTRSACLWAQVRRREGQDLERLLARAAEAGYDFGPLRLWLG